MALIVANFGMKMVNDLWCGQYRINGSKKEVLEFIDQIKEQGNEIVTNDFQAVREGKDEWTAFIQFSSIEQEEKKNISDKGN